MKTASEFRRWIDQARAVRIENEIARRHIELMRSTSVEWCGPCPVCGGRDRFSININKQVFYCRRCDVGGDVVDLVRFLDDCSFFEAGKKLTSDPPPDADIKNLCVPQERNRDDVGLVKIALRVWHQSEPLLGTIGERYLREVRCINVDKWPPTIRFHPRLIYGPIKDGRAFPGIVCPVQNAAGQFRGIWRIFLDPEYCGSQEAGIPEHISKHAIECAAALIADYFTPMAERVYGDASLPLQERGAASLARWIVRERRSLLNARNVRRQARLPGLREAGHVKAAIEVLIEANRLRAKPGRDGGSDGRQRDDYQVNPRVIEVADAQSMAKSR